MLGDNYLAIDGIPVPNPVDFSKAHDDKERVNESEAGGDLVTSIRLGKLDLDLTFNCSSFWAKRLEEMTKRQTVGLTFEGVTKTGRLRLKKSALVENSERTQNTAGLWVVSVRFMEV